MHIYTYITSHHITLHSLFTYIHTHTYIHVHTYTYIRTYITLPVHRRLFHSACKSNAERDRHAPNAKPSPTRNTAAVATVVKATAGAIACHHLFGSKAGEKN